MLEETETTKGNTERRTDDACVKQDTVLKVSLNFEDYVRYLDDNGLSDDQKHQMLKAMADILTAFVDLGFAIDPVSHAKRAKEFETENPIAPPPDTSLELNTAFDPANQTTNETQKEIVTGGTDL